MTHPKEITAETVIAQMQRTYEQQAREDILNSFNAIVLNNDARNRMPENVFRDFFLPYFIGERDINDANKPIARWVSFAGTPMAEVVIVDANDKELFVVPSLYDTSSVNTTKPEPGKTLAEMVTDYKLHNNYLPSVGFNYLVGEMRRRLPELVKDLPEGHTARRWHDILVRYNKIQPNDTLSSTVVNANAPEDLEYD